MIKQIKPGECIMMRVWFSKGASNIYNAPEKKDRLPDLFQFPDAETLAFAA